MSVKFYTEQDSGSLKFVEEVEGTDDVGAASEALFEARPRLANNDEFVVIVTDDGSLDAGIVGTLRKTEVTQTAWSFNGLEEQDEDDEEEEPVEAAPKRKTKRKATTKKAAAKKAPAKKAAPKSKAKAAPKRKPAAKKSGKKASKSPFTRSDNDE